jgi:CENP-A-NAC centromere complex subunit CENP-U
MNLTELSLSELATELVANAKTVGALEGRATSEADIDELDVALGQVELILMEFRNRQTGNW